MKKIFSSIVCILLSISIFANKSEEQKDPFQTLKFQASSVKDILCETSGGNISVNGNATSEAVVDVFVTRDNWSDAKIRQTLQENYDLKVNIENGKLIATAKPKKSNFKWSDSGLSISFKISVPGKVNSQLRTSGGSIRISNLSTTQDIATSGGSLSIENITGKVIGRTSGGSINVVGSKSEIDVATSGGSISASKCSGAMKMETSGGSINMSELDGKVAVATSGGSINAENVNGSLNAATSGGSINMSEISGNLDAATSGGNINVSMKSVNEFVRLSNSGNIRINVPGANGYNLKIYGQKVQASELPNFQGSQDSRRIDGTVKGGGPTIELKSSQKAEISFN